MALKGVGTVTKMDGRTLHGIRSVKVCIGLDSLSTVTLEFAATATISGEAQVWVRDLQQGLRERVIEAEQRAERAEARADEAESEASKPPSGAMAYIVPVPADKGTDP